MSLMANTPFLQNIKEENEKDDVLSASENESVKKPYAPPKPLQRTKIESFVISPMRKNEHRCKNL